MNDIEKIIELLDKGSITNEEKILLNGMLDNNPEARKIHDTYLNLKATLKRDEHLDEKLIAEYVLYKNDISSDRVIILLSKIVEDHIRQCKQCENIFKELNVEYAEVDTFVAHSFSQQTPQNKQAEQKGFSLFSNFSFAKYTFTSLTAVVVLYLGLFAVSSLTTPDYKKSFLEGEDFYTTRGRTSELFQRGLDAIDRKDYDSAIKYLQDDVNDNRFQQSIFYTHFVLGMTFVNKAESDFLGLFKSFDEEDVRNGIIHFEKSIELNRSGNFNNLKLDAEYFIGKSYLMIDEIQSAKKHLQLVIDGKGSYYKDAEDIIKKI